MSEQTETSENTVVEDCGAAVDMIPDKESFPVNVAGFDGNNQMYVQVISKKHSEWWSKLELMMSNAITTRTTHIPFEKLKVNLPVILRQRKTVNNSKSKTPRPSEDYLINYYSHENTNGNYNYHRAWIAELPSTPKQQIVCFKVDQYRTHRARYDEIFEIPQDIATIPPFAVQCYLAGLEFFLGIDTFDWSNTLERISTSRDGKFCNYMATKVGKAPDGKHILKLECPSSDPSEPSSLLVRIHGMVYDQCQMVIPKVGEKAKVVLTHMDTSNGCIWFQYAEQPMIDRIGKVLKALDPSKVSKFDPADRFTWQENWKHSCCTGIGEMLVVKYKEDYYRAKRTKLISENLWEIEFIDYGNREVKDDTDLMPARFYDLDICLVPAQCLKARFDLKNLDTIWEVIENGSVVEIEILPFINEGNTEILNIKILLKEVKSSKGTQDDSSTNLPASFQSLKI